MATMVRRAAARALLAGGAAVVAILLARECENRHSTEVTVVVDPRPLGDGVQAVRVDLLSASSDGGGGSIERRYRPGEERTPVRLRAGAPGAGAELSIEVETDTGMRRTRRAVDLPPGSTVTVRLGEGDVTR